MKTKNYISLISIFFICQNITAQISLDTVFVGKKKVVETTSESNVEAVVNIRYYYFPNLNAYFDTKRQLYIYKQNGNWITAGYIPAGYRGYCLRNDYHVPIDEYYGEQPYLLLDKHKKQYPANFSSKRKLKDPLASE
ncbi:hypothetical protein [Flavobacterium sp. GT3R68]|uniref:hypothetical protein n=1 Tax=Flavobacterium sp. GT3R68 TaxID=2594437 RepID=UPI000F871D5B|nr:hypothetical protein [Flavobacterium sp. GT3R68]RTY95144.1 hypothetical protein EKL32_06845 [Flavobacterium sp. GSN2]TRW91114.1 hypothetical protein FNW07_09820 [Flavobacterium sp. GT3R68]